MLLKFSFICLLLIQSQLLAKVFEPLNAEILHSDPYSKGIVIVLSGSSCAGKTTIIHEIRILEPDWIEEGADLTGANYLYDFLEKNHEQFGVSQEDWDHLHAVLIPRIDNWHIHHAVSKKEGTPAIEYVFKDGISNEDQERAMKTALALNGPIEKELLPLEANIDNIVMDKILEYSMNGKNSVFDLLDIDKVFKHPISKQALVRTVFVYCPFDQLTERIAERNRKAFSNETDLSEVRAGVFPLLQYGKLVRPRQLSDSNDDVIDRVTKKNVEADFDTNFEAWIKDHQSYSDGLKELEKFGEEGILEKRAKEKSILLTSFGFEESDLDDLTIELVPRKKYDLIINTTDPNLGSTPSERGQTAAKIIIGRTHS